MLMQKKIYIILSFVVCSVVSSANNLVWQCDFEEPADHAGWVMNSGPQGPDCANKWYIGKSGNYSANGQYGLFVSDNGEQPTYNTERTMFVTAYNEGIDLPAGDYIIQFDYRKLGKNMGDSLHVCWVPVDVKTYSASSTGASPTWTVECRCVDTIPQSSIWIHVNDTIHSDGTPHKLVFFWMNTQSKESVPPAACVDNIEISVLADCPSPTNLKYMITANNELEITWRGRAESYDIRCLHLQNGTWHVDSLLTSPRYVITDMVEGLYVIDVRSRCGDNEKSSWTRMTAFCFLYDMQCINYLDITNNNCYTGTSKGQTTWKRGKVDNGYESISSRHTLHYMYGEYDPRTNNKLRTIPEGYLASVRLGNWESGNGAEAIEYKYEVPESGNSILTLHYAVVLEDPKHDEVEQPRFTLDILDNGQPLEGGCGATDFRAGKGDMTGWHTENSSLLWKDWTEISINLSDYVGHVLTIRLQTFDCTLGGHYGYAYFVLDCADGHLAGQNCGEDNPTTYFEAPNGFDYRWYCSEDSVRADGSIAFVKNETLSEKQSFTIGLRDTLLYYVDIISKTNGSCYYTLEASGLPRFPKAIAKSEIVAKDCDNIVSFENTSCIYYKNQITDKVFSRQEGVDYVVWDFGDGTMQTTNETKIEHEYPRSGGDFQVTLSAYIANGNCVSDTTFMLHLPNVNKDEREVHLSVGDSYDGYVYWNEYSFDKEYIDADGCVTLVHVYVHEKNFTVSDSICEGNTYVIGSQELSESGQYVVNLKNQWQLDSIVTLNLTVIPLTKIVLPEMLNICIDDGLCSILMDVKTAESVDSVYIEFMEQGVQAGFDKQYVFALRDSVFTSSQFTLNIPLPPSVLPNYYDFVVWGTNKWCDGIISQGHLRVNYSANVVNMVYGDDVIGFYHSDLNGGYVFTDFQWYKNGVLQDGATQSYLSTATDADGTEYTVEVTRDDGIVLQTCPVYKTASTGVEDIVQTMVSPTLVKAGQTLQVYLDEEYRMCDVLGNAIASYKNDRQITAPSTQGVYLLIAEQSHQIVRFIVY